MTNDLPGTRDHEAEREGDVAAGYEPLEWAAGDPDPNEKIDLPQTIIQWRGGSAVVVGEVGILTGAGGRGKSTLSMQIALTAAAMPGQGYAAPFDPDPFHHDDAQPVCEVIGGPVVALGYEDRLPWVRHRLRLAANMGGERATNCLRLAAADPVRLSVAATDTPLFAVPPGGRRDALPEATPTYRQLWERVKEIGARLVLIDPTALALEAPTHDSGTVGRFVSALRRDAHATGSGILLVAHSTKAARRKDAPDADPGIVSGSHAWFDRVRAVWTLKRPKDDDPNGDGDGLRLALVKANYAQCDDEGGGLRLNAVRAGDDKFAGFRVATPSETSTRAPALAGKV